MRLFLFLLSEGLFISFTHVKKWFVFFLEGFLFEMGTGMTNSSCNLWLLSGSTAQTNGPWRMRLKIEECLPKNDYLGTWISKVEMRHAASC